MKLLGSSIVLLLICVLWTSIAIAHPVTVRHGTILRGTHGVTLSFPCDDHHPSPELVIRDGRGDRLPVVAGRERSQVKLSVTGVTTWPLSLQWRPSRRSDVQRLLLWNDQDEAVVLTRGANAQRIDHPDAKDTSPAGPTAAIDVSQTPWLVTLTLPVGALPAGLHAEAGSPIDAVLTPAEVARLEASLPPLLEPHMPGSRSNTIKVRVFLPGTEVVPPLNLALSWCEVRIAATPSASRLRLPLAELGATSLAVTVTLPDGSERRGMMTKADPWIEFQASSHSVRIGRDVAADDSTSGVQR